MRVFAVILLLVLAACAQPDAQVTREQADARFDLAVARVIPVAVALCRQDTSQRRCDFEVVVDRTPSNVADARQSLTPQGRPILTVNTAMIMQARHVDEIAFVLAHEAAHHVHAHLPQLRDIITGAPGGLAMADTQAELAGLALAQQTRRGFELEADALGAQIAAAAGFDPINGAAILDRITPDHAAPSVSHPTRAERLHTIRHARATRPRDNAPPSP